MKFTKPFCLLIILLIVSNLNAAEKEKLAVVEFKNRSESAFLFSGSDLAAWMSKELKKEKRFDTVDRKAVAKIVKVAEWDEERLSKEGELKLREIPANYALYGSLTNLNSSVPIVTGGEITPRRTTQSAQGVFVLYYFELVDLQSGKSVKTFQTEGEGYDPSQRLMEMRDTAVDDDVIFKQLFEEASKTALRRAAHILSKVE